MAQGKANRVLEHLHRLVGPPPADGERDRQLVQRFASERDEAAFAALVHRYGPLVLGVCHRTLNQAQDAEDAFQATFLVLARKAASISWGESIGSWLYEVAHRVALKAKAANARRRAREKEAIEMSQNSLPGEPSYRELAARVDEELVRLPGKYRAPLVLCYVEGQTRDQAAQHLGWSLRTLERRLQQGRELLRRRLSRRGITLSAGLLVTGLVPETATVGLSGTLCSSAVKNAVRFAVGGAAAGAIPVPIALLAKGFLKGVVAGKLKVLAAFAITLGLLAGAGVVAQQTIIRQKAQVDNPGLAKQQVADQDQTKPQGQQSQRTDLYGDPLPPRTLARLGTVRLRANGGVAGVAFSPDARTLITGTDSGHLHFWDMANGKERLHIQGHLGRLYSLALSPDGTILATRGGKIIHLWDLGTGKELRQIPSQVIKEQQGGFSWPSAVPLVFSPDGKKLASISSDYAIHMWEVATGKECLQLPRLDEGLKCIAFSPDGKTLLATSGQRITDGGLNVWDAQTGKEIQKATIPSGKKMTTNPFAISPDGKTLALEALVQVRKAIPGGGQSVHMEYKVHLWDITTGQERLQLPSQPDVIWTVAFSRDSQMLATTGMDNVVSVWNAVTGKLVHRFAGYPGTSRPDSLFNMAFSPNAQRLAIAGDGGVVQVWDLTTGREVLSSPEAHHNNVSRVLFSPDGRTLASASNDHTIRLWDVIRGKQRLVLQGHDDGIRYIAFSPDGKELASAGDQSTIFHWDTNTGKQLHKIQAVPRSEGVYFGISPLAFSSDGKTLVSYGDDRRIRVWDVTVAKEIANHPVTLSGLPALAEGRPKNLNIEDYANHIHGAEFDANGTTAALAANQSIYLVDAASGREFVKLTGASPLRGFVFAPDGKTLASGGQDKAIRLWEVASGKEIWKMPCIDLIGAVAFSQDGRTLAAHVGSSDPGTIYFWDVASRKELLKISTNGWMNTGLAFSPDDSILASSQPDTTILLWDVSAVTHRARVAKELESKELEQLWTDLASEDAEKGHQALWSLTATPIAATRFLSVRLKPIEATRAEQIRQLIADLDSQSFPTREGASKELTKLGLEAEPALRTALKKGLSAEARRRVEAILNTPPDRLVNDPEILRRLRAIQTLELIGTPEARQILEALAKGATGAKETQDGQRSLLRLGPDRH